MPSSFLQRLQVRALHRKFGDMTAADARAEADKVDAILSRLPATDPGRSHFAQERNGLESYAAALEAEAASVAA